LLGQFGFQFVEPAKRLDRRINLTEQVEQFVLLLFD